MSVQLKPMPFDDAIAYFRQKGYAVTWDWHEMMHDAHASAFTVAKCVKIDVLEDIRGAVDDAIAKGMTREEVKKQLTPILQAKGWWGQIEVADESGVKKVQLGSPHRLNTIYHANVQSAYMAGRYRQMTDPDVVSERPYWRYVSKMDSRVRPSHRKWHGTILPWDHQWWKTHFPPNGWLCRCDVTSLSKWEMDRDGLRVSPEPSTETYTWTNPKTGEVMQVPVGIDPGWDYNPGAAPWKADTYAWEKAGKTQYSGAFLDTMSKAGIYKDRFATWVDSIIELKKSIGDAITVGWIDQDVLNFTKDKGIDLATPVIIMNDKGILHTIRDAKVERGAAVSLDELKQLPDYISGYEAVLWDKEDNALLYVVSSDDKKIKTVVRINYKLKGVPEPVNIVVTAGKVEVLKLKAGRYEIIKGIL
ncbi:phage head morphogenesis protein [Candidatus Magnetominusculus xianensis]|uniref:Phage head morphogenesis protein n=1 Tax=Candidatus Magnetominusculus xianensis TaxID=1748249 RepID=A0ABR5SCM6_9BACT|nr:phage minor head protein [Candidatus Magnetominusculus xianensis]KWT81150.1 phage head morphogenesis protein [Candidatus Magnetominusculus xianensis]MBF0402980.1 minor capsid protein [Nitrospirota bacterium]